MKTFTEIDSPIGTLLLVAEDGALARVGFPGASPDPTWRRDDASLAQARAELEAYFAGQLTAFAVALAPNGTPFETRVWKELCEIPYGQTITYTQLARAVGVPHGARAVGQANGRNPIPIIIPCHRVIAAGGKLGGYGGGLPVKRRLLELELGRQPLTLGLA